MVSTGESANTTKMSRRLYRADGSARPVGLLGFPVAHSLSPAFQNVAFAAHDLPHRYEKWAVEPSGLTAFLQTAIAEDFLGLNLTVPHKRAGWEIAATHSEAARLTGAVNTLLLDKEQATWAGNNTDVDGFLEALAGADYSPKDQKVLVIGAGGASRGAVYGLALAGAKEIVVINRTQARAEELVHDLSQPFPACFLHTAPFEPAAWSADAEPFTLVVNASSHGVLHPDAAFPLDGAILTSRITSAETLFFDLTYGNTPFLRAVAPYSTRHLDGLSMLVYQGAKAFEIWTGLPAPRTIMFEAARKALLARQEQVH